MDQKKMASRRKLERRGTLSSMIRNDATRTNDKKAPALLTNLNANLIYITRVSPTSVDVGVFTGKLSPACAAYGKLHQTHVGMHHEGRS